MTGIESAGLVARPAVGAARWAHTKLRDRRYARRLIRQAEKDLDLELSRRLRRTIVRWMRSDLADLLADPSSAPASQRLRELASSEAVDLSILGDPEDFVAALSHHLLVEMPSHLHDQALFNTIRRGFERSEASADLSLDSVPYHVERLLGPFVERDSRRVAELLGLLIVDGAPDPTAAKRILGSKAGEGWAWWEWAALGLYASAHGDRVSSGPCFANAVDCGAPTPDTWRLRAAMSAVETLAEIDTSGLEDQDLVALVESFRDLDEVEIDHLQPPPQPGDGLNADLVRDLYTAALLVSSDFDGAIEVAQATLAHDATSIAAHLRLGQAHLSRAKAGRPGRLTSLEAARRHALLARDTARARQMSPQAEAVAIACQSSMLLEDWERVLQIGLTAPDGHANESETSSPETTDAVVYSALILGRSDIVERLLPRIPASHAPSLILAQLADREGRSDEKAQLIRKAWDEVEDWGRAVSVLLAWARELDDSLPLLSTKGLDVEQAAQHQEMAEILRLSRTSEDAARARMRSFVDLNAQMGMTLIRMIESIDDPEAALAAARQLTGVTDDPEVHEFLAVASLRGKAGDLDDALRHALAFLAAASGTGLERRARRLVAAVHDERGERDSTYRAHLEWLTEAGDTDAAWALVSLALEHGDSDVAARALGHAGEVSSQSESLLAIRTFHAVDDFKSAVEVAIEALETFEDDDDFCASVLAFVHSISGPNLDDEAVGSLLQEATSRFLERAPDHPTFHAVEADTDALVELMRPQLEGKRELLTMGRWLVRAGRLPLGMLGDNARVGYVRMCLGRADTSRGHNPNPTDHEIEIQAAEEALDGDVIVDLTAIATSQSADVWPIIRGAFRSVSVTDQTRDAANREAELARFESPTRIRTTEHGDLAFHERGESELGEYADSVLRLAQTTRSCRQLHFSGSIALPESWATDINLPWVSAIETSLGTGRSLLCDDYSTRTVALGHGAQTFGLVALVDALQRRGRLSADQAEHARVGLLGAGSVGLPLTAERVAKVMSLDGPIRLGRNYLADSSSWIQTPTLALGLVGMLMTHAAQEDEPDEEATALAGALVGLVERGIQSGENPVLLAGGLAAAKIADRSPLLSPAPVEVIGALDWVFAEWLGHREASVPVLADRLNDLLAGLGDGPVGSIMATMHVLSALPSERRHDAAATLIGSAPVPAVSIVAQKVRAILVGEDPHAD